MKTKKIWNDKNANDTLMGLAALVMILGIIICAGNAVNNYMNLDVQYNKQVHGYIDNARWSDDPKAMEENLTLAVKGMHNLGLTDGMYSAIFSWEQLPSNSMKNQYTQLNIQIERCKALENMNVSDYNYQSTLQSIQNYIYDGNGWGDEIAQGCYQNALHATNYVWFYALGGIMAILGFIGIPVSDEL